MILQNVLVEQTLEPGKRVTVAMGTNRDLTTGKPVIYGLQNMIVLILLYLYLFQCMKNLYMS